jgi:hypothetical protein
MAKTKTRHANTIAMIAAPERWLPTWSPLAQELALLGARLTVLSAKLKTV